MPLGTIWKGNFIERLDCSDENKLPDVNGQSPTSEERKAKMKKKKGTVTPKINESKSLKK